MTSHENAPTAAVCGNEVRYYGPVGDDGRRHFIHAETYPTYGHAVQAAVEYDDRQRRK